VSYRQQTNLNSQISQLENQISQLQSQISELRGHQNVTTQYITIIQNETSLADIYERVRPSVVLVQGETDDGSVQGSGFVYNFANRNVVSQIFT
jgi:TolA-binding protein